MTSRTARRRAALAAAPLAVLLVGGCSSAQQAVSTAQSALGTAQRVGAACQTASTAWADGTSAAQAKAALDDAVQQVDAIIASGQSVPGLTAVRDAMRTAVQAAGSDPTGTALQTAATAVQTACSVFSINSGS